MKISFNRLFFYIGKFIFIFFCLFILLEIAVYFYCKHFDKKTFKNIQIYRNVKIKKIYKSIKYKPSPYLLYKKKTFKFTKDYIYIKNKAYKINLKSTKKRIVVLGASTSESPSWPEILKKKYLKDKFEVINLATSSWNTYQSLITLFSVVKYLKPDYILLHHNVNDIFPQFIKNYSIFYENLRGSWGCDRKIPYLMEVLSYYSYTVNYILFKTGMVYNHFDFYIDKKTLTEKELIKEPYTKNNYIFKDNIKEIINYCKYNKIKLFVISMPYNKKSDLVLGDLIKNNNQFLYDVCKTTKTEFINLQNKLYQKYFFDIVHLNYDGNAIKAKEIYECFFSKESF